VIEDLAVLLRAGGLAPAIYAPPEAVLAVLSLTVGLTVWIDGIWVRWTSGGQAATWPAHDTAGAAVRLIRLARPIASA
jgi:hypothetical protein